MKMNVFVFKLFVIDIYENCDELKSTCDEMQIIWDEFFVRK